MTLALLIMAVGGAWAQEQSETFATTASTVEGTHFIISNNGQTADSNGMSAKEGITVTSKNGENITKVVITCVKYAIMVNDNNTFISSGTKTMTYNGQESTTVTATGVNATTFTFTCNHIAGLQFNQFVVYFGPEVIELKPDETGKKWILANMPANNIELQVEYEPTKVTIADNDKTMGTVEVGGESKVEWTADTWQGWKTRPKEYTVDDITMTSSESAYINEYTYEGVYLHSLSFFVNENEDNSTVTFSTTGDPFTRIEFAMIDDYNPGEGSYHGVPNIQPADGWTFEGKSAVWEGEATKSLTLKSCSTYVSKITFFKGAIPEGVTINSDGTFTVAKTATVKLTATPAEGYKFLYWEDDQTNTNPVREVTIEPGMADMTYKAVFAEITYNVTFAKGIEDADKWSATPNTEVKKDTKVDIKYTGAKKVLGVKAEKKAKAEVMTTVTWNSTNVFNSAHEDVELSKWSPTPLTYEGITISFSGTKASSFQAYDEDDHIGSLLCYGNNGDSFTFTAPSGKKFCKIEIINNGFIVFANYGDWTRDANNNNKIVWSGTAANEVTLGSVYTSADNLNSIVFYLSE